MENKKLNEKESLELISQMIQNTRTRVEKDGGTPFLIWGYGTVIISLLVWLRRPESMSGNIYGFFCRLSDFLALFG